MRDNLARAAIILSVVFSLTIVLILIAPLAQRICAIEAKLSIEHPHDANEWQCTN